MASSKPRVLVDMEYDRAAQAYLASLPPEHFMEATPQADQRKITLASFELVRARRSDVHLFNELLVQYPYGRPAKIRQVVPDNMVVIHAGALRATTNYALPLQPAKPFWVMEYVSKNSARKDYEDSFLKYERELKVPYYLIFYPDNEELTLYKLSARGYQTVKPRNNGHCAIPRLEMEIALLDGWVRFWFRGELLPLPADLLRELDQTRTLLLQEQQRADKERQRADQEQQRADQEQQRADQEQQRADRETQRADQEARARQELEEELAQLRKQLGQTSSKSS